MNKQLRQFWAESEQFYPLEVAEDMGLATLGVSWNSLAGQQMRRQSYCHAYERGRAEALAKDWDDVGVRSYSKSPQVLNLTSGQRSVRSRFAGRAS